MGLAALDTTKPIALPVAGNRAPAAQMAARSVSSAEPADADGNRLTS